MHYFDLMMHPELILIPQIVRSKNTIAKGQKTGSEKLGLVQYVATGYGL